MSSIRKDLKEAVPSNGIEVPCQGEANGDDLISVLTQENEHLKQMIKEYETKIRQQQTASLRWEFSEVINREKDTAESVGDRLFCFVFSFFFRFNFFFQICLESIACRK